MHEIIFLVGSQGIRELGKIQLRALYVTDMWPIIIGGMQGILKRGIKRRGELYQQ